MADFCFSSPLISVASHLHYKKPGLAIHFLYSTKLPSHKATKDEVLFLPQLLDLLRAHEGASQDSKLELFFTGTWDGTTVTQDDEIIRSIAKDSRHLVSAERISDTNGLPSALGPVDERAASIWYVCGPPIMTDGIVDYLRKQDGVKPDRVLCEKWW